MKCPVEFIGFPVQNPVQVKPGMKMVWIMNVAHRKLFPLQKGDALEVEILQNPYPTGKVNIRTKRGTRHSVFWKSLYFDQRSSNVEEEQAQVQK